MKTMLNIGICALALILSLLAGCANEPCTTDEECGCTTDCLEAAK